MSFWFMFVVAAGSLAWGIWMSKRALDAEESRRRAWKLAHDLQDMLDYELRERGF